MKRGSIGSFAFLVAAGFAILGFTGEVRATTSFVLQSDVQAYFGSQTNVYEASNPVVLPWPAPPAGSYAPHCAFGGRSDATGFAGVAGFCIRQSVFAGLFIELHRRIDTAYLGDICDPRTQQPVPDACFR